MHSGMDPRWGKEHLPRIPPGIPDQVGSQLGLRPKHRKVITMTSIPAATAPRRGFTLLELLVTVAIIPVLMSLLMPVIMTIRRAGSWGWPS